MHDGGDPVFGENVADGVEITDVALDEGDPVRNGGAAPRREVVENDDGVAGLPEREHDMDADVACAAGDQHRRLR